MAERPANPPLLALVETLRHVVDDAPPGLLEAFAGYELALGGDDLAAMDELFADAPDTLRGDPGGLLVGHAAIHDFRAVRVVRRPASWSRCGSSRWPRTPQPSSR